MISQNSKKIKKPNTPAKAASGSKKKAAAPVKAKNSKFTKEVVCYGNQKDTFE